jgi:StAR-related lipid transfer protein 10
MDEDFTYFTKLCQENDGWDPEYKRKHIQVFTKSSPNTDFKMIKMQCEFDHVSADVMYDVLHDGDYRKKWDKSMINAFDICRIGPNSDINYYAFSSPSPFQDRDFVTQRVWLQTKSYYAIFNHSVFHKKAPPKKGFVRAVSYLTGYLMLPKSPQSCTFYYISQCDPRGNFPAWAVNSLTQVLAPSTMKRLGKAAAEYPSWKGKHRPDFKPWLYPEQMEVDSINWTDVLPTPDFDMKMKVDETEKKETELDLSNVDENDTEPAS